MNWSGGTKNDYVIIRTSDGSAREVDDSRPPWDQPLEGHTQALTPDFIVCEHTQFCWTDLGIRFYMAESLVAEWQAAALPAPAPQIEKPEFPHGEFPNGRDFQRAYTNADGSDLI